ncbi:MAG: 50S ribosomal protein L13 [Flavobacteriaceae bacterium]|nr:MAG: 50S ribosomal protein L13 [Flavobacteriaceae bacterium]
MNTLTYKTISAKKESVEKNWWIVDADSRVLGRVASEVAKIIRGKHKPSFTPHIDCGDNVIVINAEKIRMTGDKMNSKEYISHSGYPGGQKRLSPKQVMAKKPERIFEYAVKGMLPKNRLGRQLFKNLHVYAGDQHPHEAQNPKVLELK